MVRRVWLQWKVQAKWSWLLLLLVLLFMLGILLNDGLKRWGARRTFAELYVILQVYLPLTGAVMMAGAPVLDQEEGTAEIHLSYPEPVWLRVLYAALLPVLLWAALTGATGLVAHGWYVAIDWAELYRVAFPPAIGLSMAALAGSAASRHQVGGMAVAAVWWGLDLFAPGQANKWFYLFANFRPIPIITPEEAQTNLLWLAGACLILALVLVERRERWVKG